MIRCKHEWNCTYRTLVETGALEEAAREAVDDFPRTGENATKADIAEMKMDIAAVETRLTRWVVIAGGIYAAILFGLLKFL